MKLDPGATASQPQVRKTASRAILVVATEVVVGIIFGVLLLSAMNTAVVAVIGVFYIMALDGVFLIHG